MVVPTYDEADNLEALLPAIRAAVARRSSVLVVDDASPDGTADLAERLADELGGIEVLRRAGKAGLGSALPGRVPRWRSTHGADIVRADRRRPVPRPGGAAGAASPTSSTAPTSPSAAATCPAGITENWPWRRRLLSRWGNRYAAGVLGLAVNDATAGYRAYRADALRADRLRHGRGRRLRLPGRDDLPARARRRQGRRVPDHVPRPHARASRR